MLRAQLCFLACMHACMSVVQFRSSFYISVIKLTSYCSKCMCVVRKHCCISVCMYVYMCVCVCVHVHACIGMHFICLLASYFRIICSGN